MTQLHQVMPRCLGITLDHLSLIIALSETEKKRKSEQKCPENPLGGWLSAENEMKQTRSDSKVPHGKEEEEEKDKKPKPDTGM